MEVYGNKTWNDATDNRDKTLVPMTEETFHQIEKQLENAGINYFAYSKDSKAVMAVNDKDLDWLKQIIGTIEEDQLANYAGQYWACGICSKRYSSQLPKF